LPQRARALDELHRTNVVRPQEWTTNTEIVAGLRQTIASLKIKGETIARHDTETGKQRHEHEQIKARIRLLENPDKPPTHETAAELAMLRAHDIQWSSFLAGADARRMALAHMVWADIEKLSRRLFQLCGRDHWSFRDKNHNRPETVWQLADKELSRVLAGIQDNFDRLNANPQPPIVFN
jgi:hypothetical protein